MFFSQTFPSSWLALLLFPFLIACPGQKSSIILHGQVEFDEIDIASRLSSRVKEIKVELGDDVTDGQVLAILDDDLIAIRNDRAKITIEQANLQKNMTNQATRREDLLQLQAALELAKSQRDFARQSFNRAKNLFEKGAISTQQWEEIVAKEKMAQAQYEMAKARLEAGHNGARSEQKALAESNLVQAETGLAEVAAYHKDLQLTASTGAQVFAIHARAGELVPQGFPILTLLDRQHPRMSFYVTEDRLLHFKQGQSYAIELPALGQQTIKAQLIRIQVLPSVLTQVVTEDRQARDIRSFELTLKPEGPVPLLQPGMSAVLRLEAKP